MHCTKKSYEYTYTKWHNVIIIDSVSASWMFYHQLVLFNGHCEKSLLYSSALSLSSLLLRLRIRSQSYVRIFEAYPRQIFGCPNIQKNERQQSCQSSSGSRGPRGGSHLTPHFWGPRLYSEAQITPFYTQITQTFFAMLCSACHLNSQKTHFDQKCLKIKIKPCSAWHHLTSIHDHRYAL